RLHRDLDSARDQIHDAIKQLAAAKAWQHFFRRMTEEQRRHLMAWTRAVKKIGKGTGKHAAEHRRVAREHMDGCRGAIPAWIMPLYRVAESVRPGTDAFDVVIIDEASQSGPEAILLEYLAKKIIVVGDDKQISPDHIGMNRDEVTVLRHRHVAHLPHNHVLGFDDSFFDQATVRYGGRVRLREHFRCMPEIIQFSNNLCYQADPLIPLRQYGVDRLGPVKVTHVRDGYRQGTGNKIANPPEADAIVETIIRCCNDPAYAGRSMGVISLQGDSQARLIEAKLLENLGPEELERREIVCGDAYAFQGDERDVMFLSLVAAVDQHHRIGPLTNDKAQQRFNVAASRARDQLWLFHTATLHDLNPNCMRHKLLSYCLNPRVEPMTFDGVTPDGDELLPPFESLFEQRVFCIIRERGYRVLPQVPVADYRIDLVVEGMNGRMAVECDGDAWHGPEQYDADMARQRQLERCGWTFWRVRGSAFFRDPDKAMEDLWRVLDKLQIHPAAVSEAIPHDEKVVAKPPGEDIAISIVPADPATLVRKDESSPRQQHRVIEETTALYDHAAAPADDTAAATTFAIYLPWHSRPLPDPRTASFDEVMAGLIEIVTAEGPMPCHRAYRLYAHAAGVDEHESKVRSAFNRAMFQAVQRKRLAERDEHGIPGQLEKIVRAAGSRPVIIRARGDRLLNEIPPSEIAAAMRSFLPSDRTTTHVDPETLFRRLLHAYGLDRTPDNSWQDGVLERAAPFLHGDQVNSAQIGLPLNP
ncbi:MAG: AAA domain-containing protein, partial [Thermomicrobiales bacterium]